MPSEVKATTPATCLISSCLPGQRRPSLSAPTDGITGPPGPPGLMPPGPPRPPPWRPPPLPPEPPPPEPPPGPPELIGPVTGGLINRCGSSLSASLSFQRPLKSTPAGGACASFSLAHAARHTTATTTTSRMRQSYNEDRAGGYSAEINRRSGVPEGLLANRSVRKSTRGLRTAESTHAALRSCA